MRIWVRLVGWICQLVTTTGTASGTEIGMSHGSIAVVVGSGEAGVREDSGEGGFTRAWNMSSKGLFHTTSKILDRLDGIFHGDGWRFILLDFEYRYNDGVGGGRR